MQGALARHRDGEVWSYVYVAVLRRDPRVSLWTSQAGLHRGPAFQPGDLVPGPGADRGPARRWGENRPSGLLGQASRLTMDH